MEFKKATVHVIFDGDQTGYQRVEVWISLEDNVSYKHPLNSASKNAALDFRNALKWITIGGWKNIEFADDCDDFIGAGQDWIWKDDQEWGNVIAPSLYQGQNNE